MIRAIVETALSAAVVIACILHDAIEDMLGEGDPI